MKIQRRIERIVLGVVAPIVAVPLLFLFSGFVQGNLSDSIVIFLLSLVFAAMGVGLQAIIYSLIMEYVVNPYIKNNVIAVFISALLGFCSGSILNDLMAYVGAFIGLVLGMILRINFIRTLQLDNNTAATEKNLLSNCTFGLIRNRKKLYKYTAILFAYLILYLPIREFHLLVHYRTLQECTTPFSDEMDFCHTVTFPRMEISIFNVIFTLPIRIFGLGVEVVYFPLTLSESIYWQYHETEEVQ